MLNYTFQENGFCFERINKTKAKQFYNDGFSIIICPCNLRPDLPHSFGCVVNISNGRNFEQMVNDFEYYNIQNKETGYYASYYIPVKHNKNTKYYDTRFMEGVENENRL